MKFLIISQRAEPFVDVNMKSLTELGRFDILLRSILATTRFIHSTDETADTIYCYIKGKGLGWFRWDKISQNEDEVTLAYDVEKNWEKIFNQTTLLELLETISPASICYLQEDGIDINNADLNKIKGSLVVLGAQNDLVDDDQDQLDEFISANNVKSYSISLGSESMLASQSIIYLRQIISLNKIK
jgi:tRNA pseudouridine-54 N-methylase